MRYTLVLIATALVLPSAVRAADPPVTFQTHSLDRALFDLRTAADFVGGEPAVKAVNKGIQNLFGEKGFEGLDINRPVAGYVILAPKPEDITAVVALPVTDEKAFLALCDRASNEKHKDLGKGLYQLPAPDGPVKARLRFSDGYAYIAYGFSPEPALGASAMVPVGKLYDPTEKATVAAKLHFDRVTPEVKKALPGVLKGIKTALFAAPGIGGQEKMILAPFEEALDQLAVRYALLLGGADTATVRVSIDAPTSDLVVEATLTPKPETALAKELAALKPTGNRFGGLITADTAAGFQTRLPFFFNDELKTATVKALEEGQKLVAKPGSWKETSDELFKGLIRTVKSGEADVVAGVRGPDKDGDFALAGAVAFAEPAALEKEFKSHFEKNAPPSEQDRMKWNAAKAGAVNIHTYKLPEQDVSDFGKPFGGNKSTLAFAFAPTGIFFVVGPDPVPVIKDALAVKPAAAPVLDVVVNPARVIQFVEKAGGRAQDAEILLGKEDKLRSATSLRVTGGADVRVRYALNLRLFPRAAAGAIVTTEKVERFEKK
ncbi:hypothetical protein [Frigoriglobus tundricola]|uniref:Uncharacterized protein n=1 Tax=Frigoriglobus tundricola TaxID=2774151 RepID=A0A6M5YRB3_9BACT|nr:hypothetical protein [Frigoriglobus tundricola]QJW95970.1 hypothetical protein FTUN_3524 [Frigoriglobus tundricola]